MAFVLSHMGLWWLLLAVGAVVFLGSAFVAIGYMGNPGLGAPKSVLFSCLASLTSLAIGLSALLLCVLRWFMLWLIAGG